MAYWEQIPILYMVIAHQRKLMKLNALGFMKMILLKV